MATECKFSVVVLGEMGVGKTSLLLRFTKGQFKVHPDPTLIVKNYSKNMHLMNKTVQLSLTDTSDDDRYKAIIKQILKKADGVLLLYDLTNYCSCLKLSSWLNELKDLTETVAVIVVGNKSDDPDIKPESRNKGLECASRENLEYIETSAKNGVNINLVFERLVTKILHTKEIIPNKSSPDPFVPPVRQSSSTVSDPQKRTGRSCNSVEIMNDSTSSGNKMKPNDSTPSVAGNRTKHNESVPSASGDKTKQNDSTPSALGGKTKQDDSTPSASGDRMKRNNSTPSPPEDRTEENHAAKPKQNDFAPSATGNSTQRSPFIPSASDYKPKGNTSAQSANGVRTERKGFSLFANKETKERNGSMLSDDRESVTNDDSTSPDISSNSEWVFVEFESKTAAALESRMLNNGNRNLPPVVTLPEKFVQLQVKK